MREWSDGGIHLTPVTTRCSIRSMVIEYYPKDATGFGKLSSDEWGYPLDSGDHKM
ncbi:MAG: hypothetical protein AB1646_26770 [Thermodesulfobacteriota bacterium]